MDFWIFWSSWRRYGCWCGGGSLKCEVKCGKSLCGRYSEHANLSSGGDNDLGGKGAR